MIKWIFFLFPLAAFAQNPNCERPSATEPVFYSNEFRFGQTLPQIKETFERTYQSGKRLKGRAYFDEKLDSFVFNKDGSLVKIDPLFLKSVTRHIEIALERRYADYLVFSDMGHSHFYIPQKDWESLKRYTEQQPLLYEKMMALRSLKILYHTAEQLTVKPGQRSDGPFPQDPELLWRYFSRNPVGDNQGGENIAPYFAFGKKYNTVDELAGHQSWSAGFYFTATKNGCFSYSHQGQTFYYDLSLQHFPPDPNQELEIDP